MTGAVGTPPLLRWHVAPAAPEPEISALAAELGIPHALAALLVQRGFIRPDDARDFLRAPLADLASPAALAGMDDAVARIAAAVEAGDRILVHGDYDVDGQSATAVLTRALRRAGADVVPFVPHRMRDGYDFGAAGVAAALREQARLVLTCDCGITAVEAVAAARAAGLHVIVTDHHLPGPVLPPADAIVNPQLPHDQSDLKMLCGTGVAYKLVQALVPALGLPEHLPLHLLDYVALATVADVVPLVGENRILVKHGLKLLAETRWPGLRALIAAARLDQPIRASHLGFVLGPRLNAAGRIGDAALGLRLLLTDDPDEARQVAAELEALNGERQRLDQQMQDEALAQVESEFASDPGAAFVLASDDWHPGVVGIVASRVVERYGRPVFLVAFEGETGRGSGRSISAFDLHAALVECGGLLERFGGHHMAAGLTIRREQLGAFRQRFREVAADQLTPDLLGPEQRVDLVISLEEATDELERLCRHLEPCGSGNPAPVFGVRGVRLLNPSVIGGRHLKGVLQAGGRARLPAIAFGWAERAQWLSPDGPLVDAAFRLETNTWNGRTSLQARVMALSPAQ
jgi:single-stranded-DNA-specific exonuclease